MSFPSTNSSSLLHSVPFPGDTRRCQLSSAQLALLQPASAFQKRAALFLHLPFLENNLFLTMLLPSDVT